MKDRFSTRTGLGIGKKGIKRPVDEFEIQIVVGSSLPGAPKRIRVRWFEQDDGTRRIYIKSIH